MSQASEPRDRGKVRRRRNVKLDRPVPLETRSLMAPVVATFPLQAVFTAAATPTNADLGTVVVSENTTATVASMAPITSVSELTPISSFGGDIVTIAAGPGGVFGNSIYAISRGAGDNASGGAVNRPGVIYRVDPATGKSSVFFDLNTVMNQIDPSSPTAANSLGTGTGLVNWYSITFDSEGIWSALAGDVCQQRRSFRPEQERHLRDRSQRHLDGRVRSDDRRALIAEVQPQPHGDPGTAGAGPILPERTDRRQRHQHDLGYFRRAVLPVKRLLAWSGHQ